MSAFVVSKHHIDALVATGAQPSPIAGATLSWYHDGEHHELTHANTSEIGAMLWAENIASVEARYSPAGREAIYGEGFESAPDFELPGTYQQETIAAGVAPLEVPQWATPYEFAPHAPLSPVETLSALSCYEYQSCEHDGWATSEAKVVCEALRHDAIERLPGYAEAAWEINA